LWAEILRCAQDDIRSCWVVYFTWKKEQEKQDRDWTVRVGGPGAQRAAPLPNTV